MFDKALDDASIAARLDRPELVRLWSTTRSSVERRGRQFGNTPVRLTNLTPAEVDAICGVLGRRRPAGDTINVDLQQLDTALRSSTTGVGLIETLEALGGPLRDLPTERSDLAADTVMLWASAIGHPAADDPRIKGWIESLRARGRLTRLGTGDPHQLLRLALDLIADLLEAHLDTHSGDALTPLTPLAVAAAERFGDAHALDPTTDLGILVADAARTLASCDDDRQAWRILGIELDQLSVSALVLNLPGVRGSICDVAAERGEPLRITARMLRTGIDLDLGRLERVWICENPAIVALAADRIGSAAEPLVCTEGMPSSATASLLTILAKSGADLRVHADLDAGGVAIAGHVIARFGAAHWRFGRAAYLAALSRPSIPLPQRIGATPWDPALGTAMNEHRRAIHEEAIAADLLTDLAR